MSVPGSNSLSRSLANLPVYRPSDGSEESELKSSSVSSTEFSPRGCSQTIQIPTVSGQLYRGMVMESAPAQLDLTGSRDPWAPIDPVHTKQSQTAQKTASSPLESLKSIDANLPSADFFRISSYSTFPYPGQVEFHSSFYSSASPSEIINSLLQHFAESNVDLQTYDGEARLHGFVRILGVPIFFSLKVFDLEDEENTQSKYLVEIQRRSGSIEHFTQFYNAVYQVMKQRGIASETVNGMALPPFSSLNPPALPGVKDSDDANDLCPALFEIASQTDRLRLQIDAVQFLRQVPSSVVLSSASRSAAPAPMAAAHSVIELIQSFVQKGDLTLRSESASWLASLLSDSVPLSQLFLREKARFNGLAASLAKSLSDPIPESGCPAQERALKRDLRHSAIRCFATLARQQPNECRSLIESLGVKLAAALEPLEGSQESELQRDVKAILAVIRP